MRTFQLSNNRKRTRGRKIQAISVPTKVVRVGKNGLETLVVNRHPKAGKIIFIRHKLW